MFFKCIIIFWIYLIVGIIANESWDFNVELAEGVFLSKDNSIVEKKIFMLTAISGTKGKSFEVIVKSKNDFSFFGYINNELTNTETDLSFLNNGKVPYEIKILEDSYFKNFTTSDFYKSSNGTGIVKFSFFNADNDYLVNIYEPKLYIIVRYMNNPKLLAGNYFDNFEVIINSLDEFNDDIHNPIVIDNVDDISEESLIPIIIHDYN